MRIFFTHEAKLDLTEILEFYAYSNLKKGRKIRAKLILTTMRLRDFPELGKKDEHFSIKSKKVCRALVCDNHKIIYHIDYEQEIVSVLSFFDTRQNF